VKTKQAAKERQQEAKEKERNMASADQKNATSNGSATTVPNNSALTESTAKDLLPHLESLERIIKLPVVNAAWDKSQDVYGKVKGN